MIATNTYYQNHVSDKTIPWTFKVVIDYSDYNLDNTIAAFVDEGSSVSRPMQIADGIKVPSWDYFSWINFEWGRHLMSSTNTTAQHGGISAQISDAAGLFQSGASAWIGTSWIGYDFIMPQVRKPAFVVNFTERTISTLEVVFDQTLVEYAPSFDIQIYQGSTLASTENVTGNTGTIWTKVLSSAIDDVTEMRLIINSWNYPSSPAKVLEFYTSVQETYLDDEILSISVNEESKPEKATRPIGNVTISTCDISLVNIDSHFDNDNEDSPLQNNLTKNRRIKPYFGIRGDNDITGKQVYYPLGQYYSQDWTNNNEELTASVSGRGVIQLLDEAEYTESQFITAGADQDFTYTTTAEFNAFTLDGLIGSDNALILNNHSVLSVLPSGWVGSSWYGFDFIGGATYYGSATRLINYTYVPGTTVNVSTSGTDNPAGGIIKYCVSFDGGTTYTPINGGFSFVPTTQDVSQSLLFKIEFYSYTSDSGMSVSDVTLTLAGYVALYSLADKLLQDFHSLTNILTNGWYIDPSLGDIGISNAYLKKQTFKSVLKTICEAAGANAYSDREGKINIRILSDEPTQQIIRTNESYFQHQNATNSRDTYNRVTITTQPLTQADSAEEIANVGVTIPANTVQEYTINFTIDPCDAVTFDETGFPANVSITDSTIYTWGAIVEVTSTNGSDQDIRIIVNGKPYRIEGEEIAQLDNTDGIRKNGVIELPIINPLIQSKAQADLLAADLITHFSSVKKNVEIDMLPNPALEIGDGAYINGALYGVYQNEIEYSDNGLSHIIKGVK